ncbi:hypothetical protein IT408_02815 [Candidatus Uhrbacteria bacterium]|nr:hypothetical protein [Candidatus Uhrbacteria bacterium]
MAEDRRNKGRPDPFEFESRSGGAHQTAIDLHTWQADGEDVPRSTPRIETASLHEADDSGCYSLSCTELVDYDTVRIAATAASPGDYIDDDVLTEEDPDYHERIISSKKETHTQVAVTYKNTSMTCE